MLNDKPETEVSSLEISAVWPSSVTPPDEFAPSPSFTVNVPSSRIVPVLFAATGASLTGVTFIVIVEEDEL